MASFLSKFMRGAATHGGALLADQARQKYRADLEAKRDQVLNENRLAVAATRREFELEQTKTSQEFQREQAKTGREFQLERERIKTGDKKSKLSPQIISSINKTFQTLLTREEASAKLDKDKQTPEALYNQAYSIVMEKFGNGKGVAPRFEPELESEPELEEPTAPEKRPAKPWRTPRERMRRELERATPLSAETVRASDIKPGERTATNAKGEKMVERGGRWLPVVQ